MQDILLKIQGLDEKIRYAERRYATAINEQQSLYSLKSLKVRIQNLYKERSLYHDNLQALKSSVPYLSPLYRKIESILPFQASRYAK